MIQQQTVLKVIDNSGGKTVKCIKIVKGFKKRYSFAGETIIVTVKQLRNKLKESSKVKKGDIYKAVILRTKKNLIKKDGSIIKFYRNCVTLLTKQKKPLSTKIFGPIPKNIKSKNLIKIISMSSGLI